MTARSSEGSCVVRITARTSATPSMAAASSVLRLNSVRHACNRATASAIIGSALSVKRTAEFTLTRVGRCATSGCVADERQVALHPPHEVVKIERLRDVVVGAGLQRGLLVVPGAERGEHDDANAAPMLGVLLHDAAHLPTTPSGHHHVEQ